MISGTENHKLFERTKKKKISNNTVRFFNITTSKIQYPEKDCGGKKQKTTDFHRFYFIENKIRLNCVLVFLLELVRELDYD